jgi:hypothetical protein
MAKHLLGIAYGASLEQSLSAAVYLEGAGRTYLAGDGYQSADAPAVRRGHRS